MCALFFCHLMGVVFFLLLIGSAEVYAMRQDRAVIRGWLRCWRCWQGRCSCHF